MHASEDDLVLLALGEPVPGVEPHVRACASCEAELLALASTVDTARRADLADLPHPPASVWDRISDELGLVQQPHVVPLQQSPARRPTPWRRPLVLAAAVLTAGAAAAVVLGLGGGATPAGPDRSTPLTALGPGDPTGRVVLAATADRRVLEVDTDGLPAADGFYEVWLVDLQRGRLVPLGALDDTGRARLTVPEGVDLGDYPEVDVSLEPHDGDPGHSGDSVLRGALPA